MSPRTVDGGAAEATFQRWLEAVASVRVEALPDAEGPDLRVWLADGAVIDVEVKAAAHLGSDEVVRRLREWGPDAGAEVALVVIADKLSEEAKATLREAGAGYFDRRGEAFVSHRGATLQVAGPPAPRLEAGGADRGAFPGGEAALSVALAALSNPHETVPVRALARAVGLTHGAVAQARARLREAALLDGDHRAVTEALFATAAGAFSPRRMPVARVPEGLTLDALVGEGGSVTDDLGILGAPGADVDAYQGAAVGGTRAAISYGARLVAGADVPVDLYVPDAGALDRVVEWAGRAEGPNRQASVAVAPTRLVCRMRREGSGLIPTPRVHPLVVALELAADPGRGAEALEKFSPEGVERVW